MTSQQFNDKYFNPTTKSAEPFRSDVTVNWVGDASTLQHPEQAQSNINPVYCATSECAQDLASLLSDLGTVTINLDYPQRGWSPNNQFTQSGKVPWITVKDGSGNTATENAGLMAYTFSHGYPAAWANDAMRGNFIYDLKAAAAAGE